MLCFHPPLFSTCSADREARSSQKGMKEHFGHFDQIIHAKASVSYLVFSSLSSRCVFVSERSPGSHLTAPLPLGNLTALLWPFHVSPAFRSWQENAMTQNTLTVVTLTAVVIIHGLSPPRTRIIWLLTHSFSLALCVWERACAIWGYHIRTMGTHHENLHSPQGHLTLNTSCEGCLCLCLWVCPPFSLPLFLSLFFLSMGCDFYAAIRRDSTDH